MGKWRDRAIFFGGGIAYWIAQKPHKRVGTAYRAMNWIRFGTPTTSVGLGTATMYGGAAALGLVAGAGVLVGGTWAVEEAGWAPEGSTGHAIDFVSLDVDNWYDYVPAYNVYKIAKSKF